MKTVALESINKSKWPTTNSEPADLLKKGDIRKNLKHSGIIQIYDVVQTETQVNIVMELAAGGDLFDQVSRTILNNAFTVYILTNLIAKSRNLIG